MNAPKNPFYDAVWKLNKGVFYRGESGKGGVGYGMMGKGVYVTWEKTMAKVFARMAAQQHGGTPIVKRYRLPKDIKLLDWDSPEMVKIRSMGGLNPFEKYGDPMVANVFTSLVKDKGYEGVVSDKAVEGIVVFDPAKLKEVKR